MPIRWRLTLVVAGAALVLIGLTGVLGLLALRASLLRSIDRDLARRAAPIVDDLRGVDAGEEPAAVVLADLRGELAGAAELPVQVVGPSGRVVVTSPGLPGRPSASPSLLASLAGRPITLEQSVHAGRPTRVRVVAVPADRSDGRYLVVASGSLASAERALDRVRDGVVAGGAAVVALSGVGAWLLAGAALAPVERLRTAVAALPPEAPGRALEVPATRDELAALARTMNELLGRISQALERERRLIGDASHELRTPLTVLRTELELANRPGRSRAELVESVRHAAEEADRIARLADDLLLLARSDQGDPVIHPTVQPLAAVLTDAVTAANGRAFARGANVDLVVDQDLRVPIDADRLRQAVDNLLDNALRVSPPGGTIGVRAARHDGVVVVDVVDDGPGFPPELLPHAFERFRRADTTRTRSRGGAGLGLAIVDAIARGHHGHAEAANRPGGGAVVRLVLPSG
jgi:two-component system, OmpR family, sensor kinase